MGDSRVFILGDRWFALTWGRVEEAYVLGFTLFGLTLGLTWINPFEPEADDLWE